MLAHTFTWSTQGETAGGGYEEVECDCIDVTRFGIGDVTVWGEDCVVGFGDAVICVLQTRFSWVSNIVTIFGDMSVFVVFL